MMSEKPREFWIEKEQIGQSGCYKAFGFDDPGIFEDDHVDLIRVIETSAYDSLRKQCQKLKGALEKVPLALGHYEAADRHPQFATDLDREISQFVKSAREALKELEEGEK